ncbi:hypothetical protein B0H11DRAFT_1916117 [Mycena galericulata]|nr:hypothetical protein B0H11DRAFT_1916117 [Mycena galericulata]
MCPKTVSRAKNDERLWSAQAAQRGNPNKYGHGTAEQTLIHNDKPKEIQQNVARLHRATLLHHLRRLALLDLPRKRVAKYWKITDETQLLFRGGGRSWVREVLEDGLRGEDEDADDENEGETDKSGKGKAREKTTKFTPP